MIAYYNNCIAYTECLQTLATGIGKKSKGKRAPFMGTCVLHNLAKTTNAMCNGNFCGKNTIACLPTFMFLFT